MKILNKLLMFGLLVPMAAVLVACGGGNGEPAIDNTPHTVTASESDFYDIGSYTRSATAGINAHVEVTPEFDAVKIEKVYYNGQECTKSETEPDTYEFVMPNEDVTITVDLSFIDNTSDNFLEWDKNNEDTFEVFIETEDDSYFPQWDDGKLSANFLDDGLYNHDEQVFSLNQDVVPDEALTVAPVYKSMSNLAIGFTVKINRSLIHAGTAQIVLLVDDGRVFGEASLLVCTITVVDSEVA